LLEVHVIYRHFSVNVAYDIVLIINVIYKCANSSVQQIRISSVACIRLFFVIRNGFSRFRNTASCSDEV